MARWMRVLAASASLILLLAIGNAPRSESQPVSFSRETVASGLEWPVSFAFSPDGRIVYSERFTGRIRIISGGAVQAGEVGNVSVETAGEQGLLGLALDPDFEMSAWVYVYHTYRSESIGDVMNRVWRFPAGGPPSGASESVLDGIPAGTFHNGGILGFAPDKTLFITTGDTTTGGNSQDPLSLAGKVLRVHRDGSVPSDNPFPGSPVFTLGHRNVFGLAFHPGTGLAYVSENGPSADDEVNVLDAGANYGWPVVLGSANDSRFHDPILTFPSVIAPTGLAFYVGRVSAWGHSLFLGDWNRGVLQRIVLAAPEYRTVLATETIVDGSAGILDVEMGPDGFLYFSTPDAIYRLRAQDADGILPFVAFGVVAFAAIAGASWVVLRLRRHRASGRAPEPKTASPTSLKPRSGYRVSNRITGPHGRG